MRAATQHIHMDMHARMYARTRTHSHSTTCSEYIPLLGGKSVGDGSGIVIVIVIVLVRINGFTILTKLTTIDMASSNVIIHTILSALTCDIDFY